LEDSLVDMSSKVKRMSTAQHISHVADHNTLSKEATKVDRKMKPESSRSKSSKENMSSPVIAAVEGGFHTQFLLFTRNDVVSASAAAKAAFLLKVYSNCCWDSIRPRILEMIARRCPDNTVYPPLEQMHIDGFLVEILPKDSGPEMLPPDAQKKLMSRTLHAICVRVTVDHSVISPPLRTSLATGLSAFTKLKMNFPSEKSYRNIESSHNAVEKRGDMLPQMATSSSFGPFLNRPLKSGTVSQSSPASVTNGNREKNRLQMAIPTNSVQLEPASSQSLANSSIRCSKKFGFATTSLGYTKPQLSDVTECAQQPVPIVILPVTEVSTSTASNVQSFTASDDTSTKLHSSMCSDVPAPVMVLPLSAYSSEFSSSPTTNSYKSQKKPKSLLLPIVRVPKSENITQSNLCSDLKDASCSSQMLKSIPASTISQTVREVKAEVIVVEEGDTSAVPLPARDTGITIPCVQYSSEQLPASHLQSSASHSFSSVDVQNVSTHENSTLPDQSASDVPISDVATHSVSLASINKSSLFTDPVIPVTNTACLQSVLRQQSVLKDFPGCEHTAVKMEQVAKSEPSENVERSTIATELICTGLHLTENSSSTLFPEDTETDAEDIHMRRPVVDNTDASLLMCCEELSEDADNFSVAQQKNADNSQQSHDVEYLSVSSTDADVVVSGAASSGRQLSSQIDEVMPMDQKEHSSVIVSGLQQLYPADSSDKSVLEDNIVEIVQSDEVRTSWVGSTLTLPTRCLLSSCCLPAMHPSFCSLFLLTFLLLS